MLPTSSSLPAEIAATCAIALESSTGRACSAIFSTKNADALSIPRFSKIALAPAATFRKPSLTIA